VTKRIFEISAINNSLNSVLQSYVVTLPQLMPLSSSSILILALKLNWHHFPFTWVIKDVCMKTMWKRLSENGNQTHEGFHFGTTIAMILLFLAFWGVSFYVLLNSYA
jgi:hypothetical protein